jgi:hypothetical protein
MELFIGKMKKTVDEQTEKDFRKWPVWEFCNDDTPDETAMSPVKETPVDHLRGRVVASEMSLANGQMVFGLLSNIDVRNVRKTQQFRMFQAFKKQKKFSLGRYFDMDSRQLRGPEQLAKFLGLQISEVFPITYDISHLVNAPPEITRGQITLEPVERLSPEERRKLIF